MNHLLTNQESERILFREVRKSDYKDWLKFHQDPNTSLYWKADYDTPEIECEKWYQRQFYRYENNLGGMNALIEKQTGRLIGHCGLLVQIVDKLEELEIGYSLLPEFWNKGFASEAALKCRDFAFSNGLSESLISIISLSNKASEKVARKNGMTIEKITTYNQNKVNIWRIDKVKWEQMKVS